MARPFIRKAAHQARAAFFLYFGRTTGFVSLEPVRVLMTNNVTNEVRNHALSPLCFLDENEPNIFALESAMTMRIDRSFGRIAEQSLQTATQTEEAG